MARFSLLTVLITFLISSSSAHSNGFELAKNWQFIEEIEGIKLYQLPAQEKGVIPFRAVKLCSYPLDSFVRLLIDWEEKSKWIPKLKKVELYESIKGKGHIFSEYYHTPWPFYDRQMLLIGGVRKQAGKVTFWARDFEGDDRVNKNYVRAGVRYLEVALTPKGGKTIVDFKFIGDMGGVIPMWISNIIQKKWPVKFIGAMEKRIEANQLRETDFYRKFMSTMNAIPIKTEAESGNL